MGEMVENNIGLERVFVAVANRTGERVEIEGLSRWLFFYFSLIP